MCFHTYNSIASSLLSINREKSHHLRRRKYDLYEPGTLLSGPLSFMMLCHTSITRLALCLCFNLIESRLLGSFRTQQLNEWVCIFEMRLSANELKERWRGSEECLTLEDFSPGPPNTEGREDGCKDAYRQWRTNSCPLHTCSEHPALLHSEAFTQPRGLYMHCLDPVTSIRRWKLPSLASGDKEIPCLEERFQAYQGIFFCVIDFPQGKKKNMFKWDI